MQMVTTIGLDIAKSVFQVHGVDAGGQVVIRRQLKRRYVLAFFEKLPPCLVDIEACASSHHWSRTRHTLYGAKLLENIVQALARIIVMNAALRIRDRGKGRPCPWAYRFVHQAHDELVFIVPDTEINEAVRIIHAEMVRPPSWGKDIPLVADIGKGASYGEAK